MRVLRVAFLSSAALDLAAALALVLLALRYGHAWRAGTLTDPRAALMVLLLMPEFFAPLRVFAAAYQDMFHAAAAAEALVDVPPHARRRPSPGGQDGGNPRRQRDVRGRSSQLGQIAQARAERSEFPCAGGGNGGAGRSVRRRQVLGDRDCCSVSCGPTAGGS